MIKIEKYYTTLKDINTAEEPYKSVASLLDQLYLEGIGGWSRFSPSKFKIPQALSCMRTIAEELATNQTTFVSYLRFKRTDLVNNPSQSFRYEYDGYVLPNDNYSGTIFGGVYYILAAQGAVDDENLNKMDTYISSIKEAKPYFDYFKAAYEKQSQNGVITSSKDAEIMQLKQELDAANNHIKELETIPDEISANQKVRMELLCKLFEKAGIYDKIVNIHGNKKIGGELMRCLLNIEGFNICRQYFNNRNYKNERNESDIEEINKLLEKLDVDFRL